MRIHTTNNTMKTTKRSKKKIAYIIIPFVALVAILYYMFEDSYQKIFVQLQSTKWSYFLIILGVEVLYLVLDAIPFKMMINRHLPQYSLLETMQILFVGIFMNVTTLGTGIKPAQAYELNKRGIGIGRGLAILTLPYVYHKFTILLYASVALLLRGSYFKTTYADSYHYIYAGYGFSILIIAFLILLCVSQKFHQILFYPFDRWLKPGKWYDKKEKVKLAVSNLQEEAAGIITNYKLAVIITASNMVKMTCWYIMPYIGYIAVGGAPESISIMNVLATSAFMQLIIGVIPVTGGMGSTEIVYTLLYEAMFGKVAAGSSLILYRLATYYLPFLVAIPVVAFINHHSKNKAHV